MSMETDCIASDPVGGVPVQSGSFSFPSTWITNNNVTIGYTTMPSCNLTINGTVISTINGTGTMTYPLTIASGNAVIACGAVSTTVQVISYIPAFT